MSAQENSDRNGQGSEATGISAAIARRKDANDEQEELAAFDGWELNDMIYFDAPIQAFKRALALPYYQNGMGGARGGGNGVELSPAKLCLLHAKPTFLRALMEAAKGQAAQPVSGGGVGKGKGKGKMGFFINDDPLSLRGGYNGIPTITLAMAQAGLEECRGDVLKCLQLLVAFEHPSPLCNARDFNGCTVLHRRSLNEARRGQRTGVERVAIVDFDVHHGNGTEVIVRNVRRRMRTVSFAPPSGRFVSAQGLTLQEESFKLWLDETDPDNIFFASVHGSHPTQKVGVASCHISCGRNRPAIVGCAGGIGLTGLMFSLTDVSSHVIFGSDATLREST
ncbi:unnamed protein product [Vitrella brassicaformis CCMP3155]|uniref:Histone deacetylase domain-containing protein n=1 Tax=Vitrella brassicaformis (strain CCMP3155) TaxID=1169540 RepID=A0A0G4FUS2_VITBC|nr:unnamed protein product [Vitrella brassicaformis CCMP3155]|eukprot:CEM18343.1 unnamed protein product [Vitrella brassicaformis CCMP3155]